MRQVRYTYAAVDYNGIAATQNITTSTGAEVVLNGVMSNYPQFVNTGGNVYAVVGAGIQRTIGVFSTGNLSGVVFYASGLDLRGTVVTASFAGASGGSSSASDSFATFSGVEFYQVNTILCTSAATSNFTVGTGATGSTNWTEMDVFQNPFAVTVAVAFPVATTTIVTVQDTPDDVQTNGSPIEFEHPTLASVAVDTQSNYAYPARFVRGIVSSMSATGGSAQVTIQQAGS